MLISLVCMTSAGASAGDFFGDVVDDETGEPIPCRVYVQSTEGDWHFVTSANREGSALPYREQWVPMPDSVELHTTISAHRFRLRAPAGEYQVTIERGKEYIPLTAVIRISDRTDTELVFRLRRWIDMNRHGWYSGETHVHRRVRELPNAMLAENLNIAFPVTFWTVNSGEAPGLEPSPLRRQGPSPFGPRVDHGYEPITVDDTHVIVPRNTEYEIFNIGGKRHVLGAVFILNHRSIFADGMPPVADIARQAHAEGALLDLDKHSWPWSMMLVPVAGIDLYELSNNSVWRTKFGFRHPGAPIADYMVVEKDDVGLTEWGWLQYGFQNYYSLLNCGFKLQPTAGTASGVHPVPLGYSRVYVYTGDRFSPETWIAGLKAGRSFVTTGPMLMATLNDQLPGEQFRQDSNKQSYSLSVQADFVRKVESIEVICNGIVVDSTEIAEDDLPASSITRGATSVWETEIEIEDTSWIAVRCTSRDDQGKVTFAHTAPWHIAVDDRPMRPRREEVEYLLGRVNDEIQRNREVVSAEALAEFEQAADFYRSLPVREDETDTRRLTRRPERDQRPDFPTRRAEVKPSDWVTEQLDQVYAEYDDRKLHADIFSPTRGEGPHPAVLVVHGGGWLQGDKTRFRAHARYLAQRGYVAVAIEYRLGGEALFPAAVEDCHAAVRWMRGSAKELNIDPNQIVALGGSAGGHLAGLLAATANVPELYGQGGHADVSSRISGAVVMAGPMELATGPVAERSRSQPDQANSNRWIGKSVDEAPELYRLGSVSTYLSESTPPIYFQTGEYDRPDRNADTRRQLQSLGVRTGIAVYRQGRHGCWNQEPWFSIMLDDAVAFFDEVLNRESNEGSYQQLEFNGETLNVLPNRVVVHRADSEQQSPIKIPRLFNPTGTVHWVLGNQQMELELRPEVDHWEVRAPRNKEMPRGGAIEIATKGTPRFPPVPPITTADADGIFQLGSHLAIVHGEKLRYEPQPHKNTVGYWTIEEDWCEWFIYAEHPAKFDVEILQGCGEGQGGSEVEVRLSNSRLQFTVEDTGHFQNFKSRSIGTLEVTEAGVYSLQIRPIRKAKAAVMDVREIKLIPRED